MTSDGGTMGHTTGRTMVRGLTLIALLAAACSTGCTTWRAQKETAEQVLAKEPPRKELRVTLASGLVVTVLEPRIQSDSLRGVVAKPPKGFPSEWLRGGPAWDEKSGSWSGRYVVIPTEPVQKVEILTTDALGTTAIVVVLGGLTAAGIVMGNREPF